MRDKITNADVLAFINFWLREFLHIGHKDVKEKTKILKLLRREIQMGITAGLIQEDSRYVYSAMAKLMEERYPELKIRMVESFIIPSDITKNGLKEIGEYIEKNPMDVAYGDYIHWSKLARFFATRRVSIPLKTIERIINFKSNIIVEDGKFVLKQKGDVKCGITSE